MTDHPRLPFDVPSTGRTSAPAARTDRDDRMARLREACQDACKALALLDQLRKDADK